VPGVPGGSTLPIAAGGKRTIPAFPRPEPPFAFLAFDRDPGGASPLEGVLRAEGGDRPRQERTNTIEEEGSLVAPMPGGRHRMLRRPGPPIVVHHETQLAHGVHARRALSPDVGEHLAAGELRDIAPAVRRAVGDDFVAHCERFSSFEHPDISESMLRIVRERQHGLPGESH
jgi:hypothetical protein